MKPIIIHPSYFPPTTYLAAIVQNEGNVLLEAEDHFQKQTFRNRMVIGTDKGPLTLSIPIRHQKGVRQKYREVVSEPTSDWNRLHWKGLQTAYRTSAFFEFFETDLAAFFEHSTVNVFEHNINTLRFLCDAFRIPLQTTLTSSYQKQPYTNDCNDLRDWIHPKIYTAVSPKLPYAQVFDDKINFQPNLSSLDLLVNLGPKQGIAYLKSLPIAHLF